MYFLHILLLSLILIPGEAWCYPLPPLRDFHTDRPGSTNTPYTVGPGHYQFEFELVNYSKDQLNYPNFEFRTGITNSLEISVTWLPAFTSHDVSGMGDTNLRVKKNMLGDDRGPVAWAIMPGMKIPTHTHDLGNNKWEPYLMFPLSITFNDEWEVSLMPEFDLRKNGTNDGYHSEFISPFTFGHHLFGIYDGYVEFVSRTRNDAGAAWINYLGFGFTARLAKKMQLDAGMNSGLNSASPQLNPFAGYSVEW